jgi:S-DNA-T family DNA segregation ATPase FtsK/SpoIIIE
MTATPQTTGADDQLGDALGHLAGGLLELGADGLLYLLAELGLEGVAVLAAVGACVLTAKSKTFRKAEARALRATFRGLWHLLAALVAVVRARAGHRGPTPTAEERRILARLDARWWRERCEGRGLADTLPGRAKLTESGIVAPVRCAGQMTPGKLRKAEDHVRALLGLRAELRLSITARTGDWAELRIVTRSAADTLDDRWTRDAVGIGVDTVTGKPVDIPIDARLLVCGASGSGKSWSLRPLMARAVLAPDAHLVFIDGKGEEADGPWAGICRTAVEPDEIRAVVAELHREMNRRRLEMKRRGISVWDGDTLYVVVDEGRVILSMGDKEVVQQLIDISALGRSRRVVLCWATQYPVTSGSAPGAHPQIAANTDAKFALRVKNLTHAQVALDDDADYGPHLIGRDQRGHGYLAGHGPHLIRTWAMHDDDVKTLPADVWHGPTDDGDGEQQLEAAEAPTLELVKAPADPAEAVLDALAEAPEDGASVPHIVERTGLTRTVAYELLRELVDAGRVRRVARGRYLLAA